MIPLVVVLPVSRKSLDTGSIKLTIHAPSYLEMHLMRPLTFCISALLDLYNCADDASVDACHCSLKPRPMLEQSMADITLIISTRRGEHMDVIRRAGTRGAVSIKGSISPKGESMVEEAHAVDGSKESNGKRAGSKMEIDVGDLDDFDGVITIGGDGTFFEVIRRVPDGCVFGDRSIAHRFALYLVDCH